MLDKQYEHLTMSNPSSLSTHLLSKFKGQSFPEQSQTSLTERDIDHPLVKALLARWVALFPQASMAWRDRALFRSLNMANEAARTPARVAATFYDVGRTLALWVSAFEIVVHPGGAGQSGFEKVAAEIEKVKWLDQTLAAAAEQAQLAPSPPVISPLLPPSVQRCGPIDVCMLYKHLAKMGAA
jgi:hypothetical protein